MKKIISRLSALAIACCCTVTAVFASATRFNDVPGDAYYAEAVEWAVQSGITAGVGENQFGPNRPCTRGQIMTMLWRAAGSQTHNAAESAFSDVSKGDYYYDAVLWAVENGITAGVGNNKFGPSNPCTRAQVMTFLWKSTGANEPTNTASQFADVPSDAYYAKAVAWAVENGVTSGVGADKFGPNQTCTRAQIVTFLCKADQINDVQPDPQPPVVPTEPKPTNPAPIQPEPTNPSVPETEPTVPEHTHKFSTKNLAEVAKKFVDDGDLDYARYLNHTDWTIDVCDICEYPDHDTIKFAHTPEEATEIMLGYVNDLRADVYGSHKYDLKMDKTLNDLAQIRAKEISKNFSHIGGTYTNASENITSTGPNIKNQYTAFLNSQGHKEIMLGKHYKYFGYGFYDSGAVYGVQLFWSEGQKDIYNDSLPH